MHQSTAAAVCEKFKMMSEKLQTENRERERDCADAKPFYDILVIVPASSEFLFSLPSAAN
jgi:hypothetical protein